MKTQQDRADYPLSLKSVNLAPKTTDEAAEFIRYQVATDTDAWYRQCLVLQRTARGIPALAPTALAASYLVPESERVYNVDDWRRGMVGFCDDPNDANEAGHVFFICGRDDERTVVTASNDVRAPGHVDYVPLEFYRERWGDTLQFAATWLNGYDFSEFNKPPKPTRDYDTVGEWYLDFIDRLKKVRHHKKQKPGTDRVVRLLTRDIDRMENHYRRLTDGE